MKEIDDILMKSIGMDVQQLYARYGHKKDWKDFLADVYQMVDKAKEISLTIQNFRKIIGHYEVTLNNINTFRFDIISIEEDFSDYEMLVEWNGKVINTILSRRKDGDERYHLEFKSGNIHYTSYLTRSEVVIDVIKERIADFIYNHLDELPF
jgi:hypothetical protein